jgi:cytosine/adenosine deaminase-related metal-dependent hydrolase
MIDKVGTITEGKLADLVVLDGNPAITSSGKAKAFTRPTGRPGDPRVATTLPADSTDVLETHQTRPGS